MGATGFVAISFVLFFALVIWKWRGAILGILDKRTESIRSQIDEAERLRDEAQALLSDYSTKRKQAEEETKAIVTQAREEAARMEAEAAASLERSLERRREQAVGKIAQAEADAVREVRTLAVEIAVAAARSVIADKMQGDAGGAMIDRSIDELPTRMH